MLKNILLLSILLGLINTKMYCQTESLYEKKYNTYLQKIDMKINTITENTSDISEIVYSVFNLEYFLVIRKNGGFDVYFFKIDKQTDSIKLLYYSNENDANNEFDKLFDKSLYWEERYFFNYTTEKNNFLDYNKSDFYYYDSNKKVIAEFHLPTFSKNPLERNHNFFLELRRKLIMHYIFHEE